MLACICLFHPMAGIVSPPCCLISSILSAIPISCIYVILHNLVPWLLCITCYSTIIQISHPPHSHDWSICSACLNHLNPPLHITTLIHSSHSLSLYALIWIKIPPGLFIQQDTLYPLDHLLLYAWACEHPLPSLLRFYYHITLDIW